MRPCGNKTSISNRASHLTAVGIDAEKDGMVQRALKIIDREILLKREGVTADAARLGLRLRTRLKRERAGR
jgi:hypothetical protein